MAVLAGEVVHIVKCVPVQVRVLHGEECYAELQVTRQNQTHYLTPRTHILKDHGTAVPCNSLLASHFIIDSTWYKSFPKLIEVVPPQILKPMTHMSWRYIKPADLATSGIYTINELDELRRRILGPIERSGILNDIAQEISGFPISSSKSTIMKLINEEMVNKLAENTWKKMWGKFIAFGTVSAGIIAIFTIIQWIKMTIDIFIRGYTLHSIFGWSFRLLAALWGTITTHLITRSRGPARNNHPGPELIHPDEVELDQFIRNKPPAQKPINEKTIPLPRQTVATTSAVIVDDKIRVNPT